MNARHSRWGVVAAVALGLAAGGCARAPAPVSYSRDVVPILDRYCRACHLPGAPGYEASGFGVQDYAALMKGTKFGAVVLPGDPLSSALMMLVEGRTDPSLKMPHVQGERLNDAEIATLRRWIEQGAKND